MDNLKQLQDDLLSFADSEGCHLLWKKRNVLSIRLKVLNDNNFKQSELAKRVIEATSFLPQSTSLGLRTKAVMQGIASCSKCIVCGNDAQVSKDLSLKSPLFTKFCSNPSCHMSHMSRSRVTTFASRKHHSVSMHNYKKKLVDAYNAVLQKFSSNGFMLLPYDEVQAYAKNALASRKQNGSPIPHKDWANNINMLCSVISHTQFIECPKKAKCIKDLKMLERLYCLCHGINSFPLCKFCGKSIKFVDIKNGYPASCPNCEQEKRRTTMGTLTYAECLKLIDKERYEVLEAPSGRLDDKRHHLVIRCKNCGYVSKMNIGCGNFAKIVKDQKLCKNCEKYSSKEEIELKRIVSSLVGSENILVNDRKLIHPYELDIVVPSCKVAIEFNGIYWHNSNVVKSNYHMLKTMKCERVGYKLMHVFEHEWLENKGLCIDYVKRALGTRLEEVDARKCSISFDANNADIKRFFKENSFQMPIEGSIAVSLMHSNAVVAFAAFVKDNGKWKTCCYAEKIGLHVKDALQTLMKAFSEKSNAHEVLFEVSHNYCTADDFISQGFIFIKYINPKCKWMKRRKLVGNANEMHDESDDYAQLKTEHLLASTF